MRENLPARTVTIGSWSGSGYIVLDPKSGAGAYMISGGLNGGSSSFLVNLETLCSLILSAAMLVVDYLNIEFGEKAQASINFSNICEVPFWSEVI